MRSSNFNYSNRSDKPKSKAKTIGIVIIALILILIIGSISAVYGVLGRTNYKRAEDDDSYLDNEVYVSEEPEEIPSGYEIVEELEVQTANDLKIKSDKNVLNVLLIGSDTRGTKGGRSDTMMIISLDKNNGKIKMISLLRDLYVPISGKGENRLNASYAFGGTKLLIDTIEQNFKIKIDKYVRVRFDDFIKVIDKIGGVDIHITEAEASIIKGVSAGDTHLNGKQALTYARIRKLDSDFGRTNRQRIVIKAVINKVKKMSVTEVSSLMYDILPLITTDFTTTELLSIIAQVGKIKDYPISELSIPVQGEYKGVYIRGMAVLVTDLNNAARTVQNFIYE